MVHAETEETDKHPRKIRKAFLHVDVDVCHRGTHKLKWYDDMNNMRVIHYQFACTTFRSCIADIVKEVQLLKICRCILINFTREWGFTWA